MIKTLMGSIRDYMKVTVATPLLVLGEVLCEMLIPFITANLIDAIKDGATVAEMLPTAGFLVLIALTSLAFGAAAGVIAEGRPAACNRNRIACTMSSSRLFRICWTCEALPTVSLAS